MPTAGVSDDITIEDVDGSNKRGFMLRRDARNRRQYSQQDASPLSPRVLTTGELTQAELPAELAQYWYQEDWIGGFGGRNHRLHPRTIAKGRELNTSVTGQLRPAWALKAASIHGGAPDAFMPTGFARVGTEIWALIGRDAYQWHFTDKRFVLGTEPSATARLYRNGVEFKDDTFCPAWLISDKSAQPYIHKADADSNWTLVSSGTNSLKYMVALPNNVMWGAVNNNIYSTLDPTDTAAWSSATAVGDGASAINALVSHSDGTTLLICKPEGIFALSTGVLESSTMVNLTPQYQQRAHVDNFKAAYNWNGRLFFSTAHDGMVELSPGDGTGTIIDRSMSTVYAPDDTELHGRVAAIHGTLTRLFILILDEPNLKYHLLMAEDIAIGETRDLRWSHMGTLSYTTSTDADLATLFAEATPSGTTVHNRLWVAIHSSVAEDDAAENDYVPRFLAMEGDFEEEFTVGRTDPGDSSYAQLTLHDGNLPQVPKVYDAIDVETANMAVDDHHWRIEYRIDRGSWRGDLVDANGQVGGRAALPESLQTLTFPKDTTGRLLELRIFHQKGSSVVTKIAPELKNLRVTWRLRPLRQNMIPLRLYLADDQRRLNGAITTTSKGDIDQIRTWSSSASRLRLTDPEGSTAKCVFFPGSLKVRELVKSHRRRPEYQVDALLLDVEAREARDPHKGTIFIGSWFHGDTTATVDPTPERGHMQLTQNFLKLLRVQMTQENDSTMVDIAGNTYTVVPHAINLNLKGAANDGTLGIVLGRGLDNVDITNVAMSTIIAEGTSTNELTHAAHAVATAGYTNGDSKYMRFDRVFTNSTGAAVSVTEIGVIAQGQDSGGTARDFLIARARITATIPNSGTIHPYFYINTPNVALKGLFELMLVQTSQTSRSIVDVGSSSRTVNVYANNLEIDDTDATAQKSIVLDRILNPSFSEDLTALGAPITNGTSANQMQYQESSFSNLETQDNGRYGFAVTRQIDNDSGADIANGITGFGLRLNGAVSTTLYGFDTAHVIPEVIPVEDSDIVIFKMGIEIAGNVA